LIQFKIWDSNKIGVEIRFSTISNSYTQLVFGHKADDNRCRSVQGQLAMPNPGETPFLTSGLSFQKKPHFYLRFE